jgi:type II secretory pathway predicted ATPase ExeA
MLIPQTARLLSAEEHERGRNVVIVLDKAHLLGVDQLEELRLLTNAELDSHSPFACLLVGQPTLRRRIKLGTFAALDQRIALRYTMNGMEAAETKTYLPTTSNSPAAATRCSATTPQTSFTKSVAASRER